MTEELRKAAHDAAMKLCTQIEKQADLAVCPHDLESMSGIVKATTELLLALNSI
ncbi:hypothetical protein [Brevibacillus panacihumi]|uniref:hypothetical protein n=1 Tax=Brevibacillus panacihumi TaxID=497735 RepID=UPI003D25111D